MYRGPNEHPCDPYAKDCYSFAPWGYYNTQPADFHKKKYHWTALLSLPFNRVPLWYTLHSVTITGQIRIVLSNNASIILERLFVGNIRYFNTDKTEDSQFFSFSDLPRSQRGEGLRCLRPLGLLRHATRRFPQEEVSLNRRILCQLDRVQYRPVITFAKHCSNMSFVGTVLISLIV